MKKAYHLKMDPQAHTLLKLRAKQLGVSMGVLVENLLSSLEFRRQKWVTELCEHVKDIDKINEVSLIKLILKADEDQILEDNFFRKLKSAARSWETIAEPIWSPKIVLKDD